RLLCGEAMLEHDILPFHPAQAGNALHERVQKHRFFLGAAGVPKDADARHLFRHLRPAAARPCGCGSAEKRDELPSLHGAAFPGDTRPYHILDRPGRRAASAAPNLPPICACLYLTARLSFMPYAASAASKGRFIFRAMRSTVP